MLFGDPASDLGMRTNYFRETYWYPDYEEAEQGLGWPSAAKSFRRALLSFIRDYPYKTKEGASK